MCCAVVGIGVGQREIVVCRTVLSVVWGWADVLCCGAGGCAVLWGFVEDVRARGICVGQREIVGTFAVWGQSWGREGAAEGSDCTPLYSFPCGVCVIT